MFRFHLSLVLAMVVGMPAVGQESIAQRIARLEEGNAAIAAQMNGISSMQARLQSDVTDVRSELKALSEKLDALAKVASPRGTFQASTVDAWGRGKVATFPPAESPTLQSTASMLVMSSGVYGSGSCSSGSCGSGGMAGRGLFGGGGLFGRRR